jgi:lipopolysaccharide export LptBFGC system permease protein LptF
VTDFVEEIERYLEKKIDYLVINDKKLEIKLKDLQKLKENISVQGGDYIYLEEEERKKFEKRGIKIIEQDLIDRESLYKHDAKELGRIL